MFRDLNRRRFVAGSLGAGVAALAARDTSFAAALNRLVALQDGPVAIDFWHRNTGAAAEEWPVLAEAFNAEMAGAIEVTAIAQGNIQELNQKIRAAAAGGGLPGATQGDDYDITQYAANGILVPFDPYIDDPENGLTAEEKADFLPSQIERHKLDVYDGQTMAFPQGFSA